MINPMLCEKTDNLKQFDDRYIYELKFDGSRLIVDNTGEKPRFWSRRGNEVTDKIPELKFDVKGIFDGEIVCLNGGFTSVESRLLTENKFKQKLLQRQYPLKFMVFDVLEFEGENMRNKTLLERKSVLDKVTGKGFEIVAYFDDYNKLWDKVEREQLEGIVIKEKDSKYVEDSRKDGWFKFKNWKEDNFVFTKFEENPDDSWTIETETGIRVKCCKKEVIDKLKENGNVNCEVMFLERTEKGMLRFPILKGVV